MLDLIKKVLGREYRFLNTVEISQVKVINNYRYLARLNRKLKISPVLKSNAYGHGLTQIGRLTNLINPPFICVDSLHEAFHLQKSGVKAPILIMGYINPENLRFKKLPFSYAVYDLDYLIKVHKYQPQAGIHIKVDTGMHRMGVPIDELESFLKEIEQIKDLKIVGLMSHLATTSDAKNPQLKLQIKNFQKAKRLLKKYGVKPRWFHLAASEAILNPKIRSQVVKVSNLARAGKSFYGYSVTVSDTNLKPALKLITTIAQIKKLKKGDKVGYDGTYTVENNLTLAILPIGYFDGVDRRLSNKGFVIINGTTCPIVGRVSMNITTVDISSVSNPKVGDRVEVISSNPLDPNSVMNIAKACDTIPHEVLVHLVTSTNRVVV